MSAMPAAAALRKNRMNKKKLIALLVFLFLLNGLALCAALNTACQFIVGQTKQEQVRSQLGEPNVVAEADQGGTVWVFNNISSPCFVGAEAIPLDQPLILTFNEESVLVEYEVMPVRSLE